MFPYVHHFRNSQWAVVAGLFPGSLFYWLKPGFISFGGPAGQISMMPRSWSKSAAGYQH
jgi:chromate transport protein ChrA